MPARRLKGDLNALWQQNDAKLVETFTIERNGQSLEVSTGKTYLFLPPGASRKQRYINDLWKGIILEMKILPFCKDALVNVLWFWSRKDIKKDIQNLNSPKDLKSILDAMGENELCPSTTGIINSTESIESDVYVVKLSDTEHQEPVFEYFWRLGWDEQKKVMVGEDAGCAALGCKSIWNPCTEEQRYCYHCKKWYHVACLSVIQNESQKLIYETAKNQFNVPAIPTTLLEIAFQPAARGGPRHFVGGNIRIVSEARALVSDVIARDAFIGANVNDEESWVMKFEEHFGMEKCDRGNKNREQLILSGQDVYSCSKCKNPV